MKIRRTTARVKNGECRSPARLRNSGSNVDADVYRIADACGFSVPYYELIGERPVLDAHHAKQPDEKFAHRIAGDNGHSIDGLPALDLDHPLPSTIKR